MDPGGQDPSCGTGVLPFTPSGGMGSIQVANLSTNIGSTTAGVGGIVCLWDESMARYLVIDAPCPSGC
jgi:hypothetical protein